MLEIVVKKDRISQSQTNNSKTKMMFSFNKAERFPQHTLKKNE